MACNADATDTTIVERFFLTYRGVRLPLQLTEELAPEALRHRNTWFRALYDAQGRMQRCEKHVYGAIELLHEYRWTADGRLHEAVITEGDEAPRALILTPA
ncbi:DUF6156 family protein [Sphaerotilus hippei]|uniref:DUF6156 family protein n=1 Tax=Sphaerotilus hippei TaxID=744406 RepID=UPI001B87AF56|nr:DUF6156 family protein [Sphaerotilus hippei]